MSDIPMQTRPAKTGDEIQREIDTRRALALESMKLRGWSFPQGIVPLSLLLDIEAERLGLYDMACALQVSSELTLTALREAGIETDDPAAGVREMAAQRDDALRDERAAVVAYLRSRATMGHMIERATGDNRAIEIERGLHRPATPPATPKEPAPEPREANCQYTWFDGEHNHDCLTLAVANGWCSAHQPRSAVQEELARVGLDASRVPGLLVEHVPAPEPAPEPRQPKFRPGDRVTLTCSDSPGTGTVAEVDTSDGGIGYRIHHHQLKRRLYFGEAVVIATPVPAPEPAPELRDEPNTYRNGLGEEWPWWVQVSGEHLIEISDRGDDVALGEDWSALVDGKEREFSQAELHAAAWKLHREVLRRGAPDRAAIEAAARADERAKVRAAIANALRYPPGRLPERAIPDVLALAAAIEVGDFGSTDPVCRCGHDRGSHPTGPCECCTEPNGPRCACFTVPG